MKIHKNKPESPSQGSVLVVALVISAIGTIGVLATVSIIGVRALQAEAELGGVDRRIKFTNSRALAREVMFRNYLPADATLATETTFSIPGDWGSVTIADFTEPALEFAAGVRTHPTGAAPLRSFSQDVNMTLNDGGFDHAMLCQMRSYNPVLSGDLLSMHPTDQVANETVRITGDLKVNGRAVFWEANYLQSPPSTMRSNEVIVPATNGPALVLEDIDENPVKPSNYIGYSQTVGTVSGGNNYAGKLDIVNNASSGVNSYFQKMTALGGQVNATGSSGSTDGLGPDTSPPGVVDAALLLAIADPMLSEADLTSQLAASSPLSSDVLIATLNRATPISDDYLIPLFNSHAPLPDDVMVKLADPNPTISQNARNTLLNNTGYSYISDGNGTVLVSLQSAYLPNLLLEDVNQVFLLGQESTADGDYAETLDPRVIAIHNSDNVYLHTVVLQGITNKRRIVFALSQTGVLDGSDLTDTHGVADVSGSNQTSFIYNSSIPFARWRMITELEGVSSSWDVNTVSTGTLIGGIRTDHSIRVTGGTLQLEPEPVVEFLESLLSRNAWIEIYK